jgi:hypothetical protein
LDWRCHLVSNYQQTKSAVSDYQQLKVPYQLASDLFFDQQFYEKLAFGMRLAGSPIRGRAAGFIEPCLPSPTTAPPSGPDWPHEIKHDGFRLLARRYVAGVPLYTRNGNDFTARFPLVVAAVATLPVRSCLIDGAVTETVTSQPRPPRRIPCRLSQGVLRGSQPDNRTCFPLLYVPVVHLAAV